VSTHRSERIVSHSEVGQLRKSGRSPPLRIPKKQWRACSRGSGADCRFAFTPLLIKLEFMERLAFLKKERACFSRKVRYFARRSLPFPFNNLWSSEFPSVKSDGEKSRFPEAASFCARRFINWVLQVRTISNGVYKPHWIWTWEAPSFHCWVYIPNSET
jgi:hypothetical protein